MRRLACLLLSLAACVPQEPPPATRADHAEHRLQVPGVGFTRLCLPRDGATRPLVLINHGSPGAAQRAGLNVASCDSEAVRFFTGRGHPVGLPLRRGYGVNGGARAEAYGPCEQADFARAGREGANDIEAAWRFLAARPDVPAGPVTIVGQSAGGWAALALAARNPPGLGRVVNMAGGRGGRRDGQANNNCSPDELVRAAGEFGATARVPTLWIYTANDSFFDPMLAGRMHRAFTTAGGQARLAAVGPFRQDGHTLFFGTGGSLVWGPMVEEFVR